MKEISSMMIVEKIESKIYLIRGKKVMLDSDLAKLYDVETGQLNRAVKRNEERFPVPDFMFRLTKQELKSLRCQIGILDKAVGRTYLPYAFSEHGIAMISSVLNSKKAIAVSIQIIKTFIKLREMIFSHKKLWEEMKKMGAKNERKFIVVFEAIRNLQQVEVKAKRKIGF